MCVLYKCKRFFLKLHVVENVVDSVLFFEDKMCNRTCGNLKTNDVNSYDNDVFLLHKRRGFRLKSSG